VPLLRRLLSTRSFDAPLASDDPKLAAAWSAVESVSGRTVTTTEAMRTAAVYASVRILSETISSLPAHVIRRAGKNRSVEHAHPVQQLIHEEPNPEMDAGEFWRFMLVYVLFGGDSYAWIERGEAGQPVALWPVPAGQVGIGRDRQRRLYYDVALSEEQAGPGHDRYFRAGADDIMHVRAFGMGRLHGMSPIQAARESIGTSRSAQDYAARFYRNDASPGGTIEVPEELTDEQYERLEHAWNMAHRGVDRAHMLAILESGATWRQVGISPQDAEFIHTRKFELGEIARIFGVPPHLIGDTEKSTSWGTGIEQQNIGFLTYSLMPWITRLERVATRSLLRRGPFADDDLHVKWAPEALLRGDVKARYEAYAIGRQWGWESTNSILQLEDRDPVDGGDDYLVPENMRRMLAADEMDVRDLQSKVQAAGDLWRAGYDPQAAADLVGIDVEHLGYIPQSVQVMVEPGVDAGAREVRAAPQLFGAHRRQHVQALLDYFARQRDELTGGLSGRNVDDILEVWDEEAWDDELAGMFRRLASVTAAAFASRVNGQFNPDEQMGQWLAANSAIAARSVNDATIEQVNRAVAQDDLTYMAAVTNVYQQIADSRAESIANDRVTVVGQAAQNEAATASAAVRTKTWRVRSGDPRPSHAAVDGQTVPVGEAFSNGAKYPGDPDLPIEERAGCTCDLEFG